MEFKFYYLLPLLAVCFLSPRMGRTWFHRLERQGNRIASRTFAPYLLIAALSLTLSGTLALIRIPVPHVHDEFAYLLGADTFARGRLTNPPHPLWQHFESIHIIQQPTYTSKYPPAQSAALAVGQRIGHPIIGVWLSTLFACTAVYWMLLAWMPARWAFVGGLVVTVHPVTLTWSYGYWGGAIAMAGGALLFGGFRRVLRDFRPRDSFLMGLGMLILANSRPYEGFVLTSGTLLMLAVWALSRQGPPGLLFTKRVGIPLVISGLMIGVEIGWYNYSVTGNPLQMPYMVHEATYGGAPLFVLQKAKVIPPLRHKVLYDEALSYWNYHARQAGLTGFAYGIWDKLHTLAQGFFWSGFLAIPLLALLPALRYERKGWLILIAGSLSCVAMLMATWTFTHYAAPLFGLLMILIIQSLRQLRLWRWKNLPCGLCLSRMILVVCMTTVPPIMIKLCSKTDHLWAFQREQIQQQLTKLQGQHLVIVHYSNKHNPNREWVYNEADIDNAKVVWARAMTPQQDAELIQYFKGRSIWELQVDAPLPQLTTVAH